MIGHAFFALLAEVRSVAEIGYLDLVEMLEVVRNRFVNGGTVTKSDKRHRVRTRRDDLPVYLRGIDEKDAALLWGPPLNLDTSRRLVDLSIELLVRALEGIRREISADGCEIEPRAISAGRTEIVDLLRRSTAEASGRERQPRRIPEARA